MQIFSFRNPQSVNDEVSLARADDLQFDYFLWRG